MHRTESVLENVVIDLVPEPPVAKTTRKAAETKPVTADESLPTDGDDAATRPEGPPPFYSKALILMGLSRCRAFGTMSKSHID